MVKNNILEFERIEPFKLNISYCEVFAKDDENRHKNHFHQECEIYINVSGEVSFVVEDKIYPIKYGDIIITRPYENHHCVYYSDELHRHYCILFGGNELKNILPAFFDRKAGEKNLISLDGESFNKLTSLCDKLSEEHSKACYTDFFGLLRIIDEGKTKDESDCFSGITYKALSYINRNLCENFCIKELSGYVHVSVNTLERLFKKSVGMSPSGYILERKLSLSAKLLCEGYSVSQAAQLSGFGDYSHYIAKFKRRFGVTPLKYKNIHINSRERQ